MKRTAVAAAVLGLMTGQASARNETDGNWLRPMTDAFTNHIMQAIGEGKGGLAEAARQHVKQSEVAEKEANRSVRRSVQECIKPGNVIDDDVQECVRGYREKTW